MVIFHLFIIQLLIFLRVFGSPTGKAENGCERYGWNVMGNHFNGGCDQTFSQNFEKSSQNIAKPRLIKRDEKSKISESSPLATIANLMNLVNSDLNLNIKADPGVACKACKTGIRMIKIFISLSKSDEDLLKVANSLCIELKIMTEDVCYGLVHLNGPSIIHILKTTNMSAIDICSFLIKADCDGVKNPNHLWYVDVPEGRNSQNEMSLSNNVPDSNSPQLKVLHISDTHFDPHYKEGTYAECNLPLCCREATGEPTNNASLSGPWGGWKCDIPEKTLDNLLEHINKQHPTQNVYCENYTILRKGS